MQYFFELGNFKSLSKAELSVVLESFDISKDSIKNFSEKIFLVDSNKLDDTLCLRIFNKLGGYIRTGQIVSNLDTFLDSQYDHKVIFGISYIGDNRFDTKKLDALANQIKRHFKELGYSPRFVLPKKTELNAAQVTKNNILNKGFELCILENKNNQMYGKTLAIQDVDGFANRDIGKPNSNLEMGMLPPKLARIMVNISGIKSGTIWDPFCGSGTIAMEAAILGLNVLASDIDPNAAKSTDENIKWLSQEGYISDILYETFQFDVQRPKGEILKKLKNTNIDCVIFEPFMGPPQLKPVTETKASMLLEDVKKLYTSMIYVLEKIDKRNIKMVCIIPSYKTYSGWKTFGIREVFSKRWDVLNKEYSQEDLKWERNNSIICRNIFILQRN